MGVSLRFLEDAATVILGLQVAPRFGYSADISRSSRAATDFNTPSFPSIWSSPAEGQFIQYQVLLRHIPSGVVLAQGPKELTWPEEHPTARTATEPYSLRYLAVEYG